MPFNLLAGIVNTVGSSVTANRQNRFNRDFQAQQAQMARDWQEDFYNKYSSPSAMVQQYKDAGLNPALMFGKGASAVGGVPSGATPSGGSQMMPTFSLNGEIGNIIQLKEMIKNNESQRNVNSAMAGYYSDMGAKAQSDIALNTTIQNLNTKEMDHLDEKINNLKQNTDNQKQQKMLMIAQEAFHKANTQQVSLKNAISDSFYEKTGIKADSDTVNSLMQMCADIVGDIGSFVGNLISKRLFKGVPKVQKSIPMPKLEVKSRFTP